MSRDEFHTMLLLGFGMVILLVFVLLAGLVGWLAVKRMFKL